MKSPYDKILLFLLIVFPFQGISPASPFDIVPDTIDVTVRGIVKADSILFLRNMSENEIRLDSITITESRTKAQSLQLQIVVGADSRENSIIYGSFAMEYYKPIGWRRHNFYNSIIPPKTDLFVQSANIDICVICPSGKTSANYNLVGDSVSVKVIFYSGVERDSLIMLGIQKHASFVERRSSNPKSGDITEWTYDSNGKKNQPKLQTGNLRTPMFEYKNPR
ncbi:MAG: hypothetical protein JWP91_3090 [Fibrobacteres bacterium]|nr:hypothetical protein [Fibrobacterota bacterium]